MVRQDIQDMHAPFVKSSMSRDFSIQSVTKVCFDLTVRSTDARAAVHRSSFILKDNHRNGKLLLL